MARYARWTLLALAAGTLGWTACSKRRDEPQIPQKTEHSEQPSKQDPSPNELPSPNQPSGTRKSLAIKHGWDIPPARVLPKMVKEIQSSPFDGVIFSGGAASKAFTGEEIDPDKIEQDLSAISSMPKNHGLTNFIILYVDSVQGGFNGPQLDTMIRNIEHMAKVLAPSQVRGIAFDNEVYKGDPWTMPQACPGLDRKACGEAAFHAGKKMMQAIIKQWPDVVFLAFFGPWLNDPRTYAWINQYAQQKDWSDTQDISSDFLAGVFAATKDTKARFIDGGEIYGLRTQEDFRKTAYWMRDEMVKESPFFPDELRKAYTQQMGVGFGVYDDRKHLFKSMPRLDPIRWQKVIEAALQESELVWIYTERHDWWKSDGNDWPDTSKLGTEGPVTKEWMDAARNAIQ